MAETTKTCALHSGVEERLGDHDRRLTVTEHAILDIRDKLLGRPSWSVCVIITFLCSTVVGLAVALLTRNPIPGG